jgi:hypothetical protein
VPLLNITTHMCDIDATLCLQKSTLDGGTFGSTTSCHTTGEKNRVPNRSTQRVELNFVAEGILDSGTVGTRDSGPGTVARYGSSNCPGVFLLESEILDCSVVRVFVLRWMEQCYHSLVPSTGTSRKLPWGSTKLVIVLTKRFGT